MNLASFKQSFNDEEPPPNLSVYAQALWYDAKEDWHKAHTLIQELPDKNASWIHAYLHRKEGDTWNAAYWYNKAGRTHQNISLDEEWEQMAQTFLPTNL